MDLTESRDGPDPVDVFVGARVRTLRKRHRMSQQDLARRLGVSFQQVQKYERAANRISSSSLYKVAAVFNLPVGAFFEGLADPAQSDGQGESSWDQRLDQLVNTPGGLNLAEAFLQMSPRLRWPFIDMARALAAAAPADRDET